MAVLSTFLRAARPKISVHGGLIPKNVLQNGQIRCMSEHRTFPLKPGMWQWHRTKDLLHFYTFLGLIPVGILLFCVNVFVGPATLEPIPEGYEPKPWEYHRHPITRFYAKFLHPPPQQDYEKYLHYIHESQEVQKVRLLEFKIKDLMKERRDYRAFYYKPYSDLKYIYNAKEHFEDIRHALN